MTSNVSALADTAEPRVRLHLQWHKYESGYRCMGYCKH